VSNGNTVTLVGNVTRDPEVRHLESGLTITSFGLAISQRRKNDAGEWEDGDPSYFDVSCFRELAENVAETVAKGNRVIVAGSLRYRAWETPEGEKRSKVEVLADEVGPSLRWATAAVTRTPREGGASRGAVPTEEAF